MENCITPQAFGIVVLGVALVALGFGMVIHWIVSRV